MPMVVITKKKQRQTTPQKWSSVSKAPSSRIIGGQKYMKMKQTASSKAALQKKAKTVAGSVRIYKAGDKFVGYVRF